MSPLARALARRRRLRGDRGAAAVEFALVSLLLFMLLFGIIEFGLAIRDKIAVTSAVRTGGRVASAEPKACDLGTTGCAPADAVTATPAGVSSMVLDTARATTAALTGVPQSSIQELWIYSAGADGKPAGGSFGSCSSECVRYRYVPDDPWTDPVTGNVVIGRFRYISGRWRSTDIDACPGGSANSVGVYLKVKHQFILGGIVGDTSIDLSDYSAFRFEPQPTLVGLPGATGCRATT
jgi:hypothetical protein